MGFQKIFEDRLEVRAEIVKGVLNEHEINAVIVPKKDSSYQFGFFEVHVGYDDVIKSIKIIEEDIKFE
ncbi:MAG: hypothetical protein ACO2ZZ_01970 [Cyclobacteriaceae bacterium]|jgi:hypothetical protein